MELGTLVTLLIISVTLLYFYIKRCYSYWKERNVIYLEPNFFYGNFKEVLQGKVHLIGVIEDLYRKVKTQRQSFGGLYAFFSPHFVPVDVELVKNILHKDFAYFNSHGLYCNEEKDPLTGHLFNLDGEKWKNLRAKLTPTFTSGRMKMMFETLVYCTKNLQEVLNESVGRNDPVNIKDVLSCFTTDVIGSVAFGLDINSIKNPDSEFREYGKRIFNNSLSANIKCTILNLIPKWLSERINIKISEPDMEFFFTNLVKSTVQYREKNNIHRKDFMHLMIQLKNIGEISDDHDNTLIREAKDNVNGLTLNQITAQCFVFFLAGFETSATTMTFVLLELAQNEDVQDRVRNEINSVLSKYGNTITYDAVAEMEYLDKTILETLRKHPPLGFLPRICRKRYEVPNSNLVIEKGTRISISVYSIHRDADFYPNPESFDPERFNEHNKANRHPFAYLPFGEGPRTCIGLRFGKLQTAVGLCCVLKNYRVSLNGKTQFPIKYEPGFISTVEGGVWLNLETVS